MRIRLQKLREAHGFTQKTFSELIGISRSHYSLIETGGHTLSLKVAIRIKKALAYFNDDLFDDVTKP